MSDANSTVPEAGGDQPVFHIHRVYLKDFSLEQPNAPEILLEKEQPDIQIQLNVSANEINDGVFFEVVVMVGVHAKVQDKTLFLVEGHQAGIFEIRNLSKEEMGPILGVSCPHILYPYLRAQVADAINRAGFPSIHLEEINFQVMYDEARSGEKVGASSSSGVLAGAA